ncbi:hypothetical protein A9Q81_08890, partial [Gammaproteobacteria bacterium 42_54_T18]
SEVKRSIADGSVGLPHVRVGHCWAFIPKNPVQKWTGFFIAYVLWAYVMFVMFVRLAGVIV